MVLDFKTHRLEVLQEKDFWKLCDFMVSNESRFRTYLPSTLSQNLTPDLSRKFVAEKILLCSQDKEYVFFLKNKKEKNIDGIFYLKNIDWVKKQAEFAYGIGYQIESKGFTTKIIKALTEYAFKNLQLKTLQIITHKTNIGSVKVAEKCGFNWIKTLKNVFTPPSLGPLDMELYEIYNEK